MGDEQAGTDLQPPDRLAKVATAARQAGLSALLLTPGPDLRYVTGYNAHPTERLTCLALPAEGTAGSPFLLVPRLELQAAQASPAGRIGLEIATWDETSDPYALVARRLGAVAQAGLSDQMWAMMVLRLRDALPGTRFALASKALRSLRSRKTPAEVAGGRRGH
jgi:Xaa-Pro aminopeptidase